MKYNNNNISHISECASVVVLVCMLFFIKTFKSTYVKQQAKATRQNSPLLDDFNTRRARIFSVFKLQRNSELVKRKKIIAIHLNYHLTSNDRVLTQL